MSALIIIGLLVLAVWFYRFASGTDGSVQAQPSFRKGLPENPTQEQLIAHAEKFWTGDKIPLGRFGEITACAGRSTYVWRDSSGKARIICHACACALAAKVYSSTPEPLKTSVGVVHGASRLNMATMALKNMWFYTNYTYIVPRRGGLRAVNENLEDFYPCGQKKCS